MRVGADDYPIKPFDFDEPVARVHALGHRPTASKLFSDWTDYGTTQVLKLGSITLMKGV